MISPGKVVVFIVFVLISYALIIPFVNLFVDLQGKVGNSEVGIIKYVREHTMTVVWGFWIIFTLGMIIAIPTMIKDGFFAPETPETSQQSDTNAATSSIAPVAQKPVPPHPQPAPAGALPPLEYQLKFSKVIILATTHISPKASMYSIDEVWKQTSSDSSFNTNTTMILDTKMWELLGYEAKEGQQVVALFSEDGIPYKSPLEIMPVENGSVTYGASDATVTQTLTLQALKAKANAP